MITYLNEQLKKMYNITDNDYLTWCEKNKKPKSYKSSTTEFIYKLRTKRLIKDEYGQLQVKKPRKDKEK